MTSHTEQTVRPTRAATDKQASFFSSIVAECDRIAVNDEDRALTIGIKAVWETVTSTREASNAIDSALFARNIIRRNARAAEPVEVLKTKSQRASERANEGVDPDDVDGMYQLPDGRIAKVQYSQVGRPYAKLLVASDELNERGIPVQWSFEYERCLIHECTIEYRMTMQEARAFGARFGTCCMCATVLEDPKSIANGIGPVCERNMRKRAARVSA